MTSCINLSYLFILTIAHITTPYNTSYMIIFFFLQMQPPELFKTTPPPNHIDPDPPKKPHYTPPPHPLLPTYNYIGDSLPGRLYTGPKRCMYFLTKSFALALTESLTSRSSTWRQYFNSLSRMAWVNCVIKQGMWKWCNTYTKGTLANL